MPFAELPVQVRRSTLCGSSWPARVRLLCSDNIPTGSPSHLLVDIEWPGSRQAVVLTFLSPSPTTGDIRFDGPAGPATRTIPADTTRVLLTIQGARASGGTAADVELEITIGDEKRKPLRLFVGSGPGLTLTAGGGPAPADVMVGEAVQLTAQPQPAATGTFRWEVVTPGSLTLQGEGAAVTVTAPRASATPLQLCVLFQPASGPAVLAAHGFTVTTLEDRLGAGRLELRHLEDPAFRAQLEAMSPEAVQRLLDAATEPRIRAYLERLLAFVRVRAVFDAAPAGERESVTFLMGDPAGDPFYRSAEAFFTLNPAGQLVTTARTLLDVQQFLAANAPANGRPWGEVNIVSHANELGGMTVDVAPGRGEANEVRLRDAVADGVLAPLSDEQVDIRTVIRIRGCALGRRPQMLRELSLAFGGEDDQRPVVHSPKQLQAYSHDFDLQTLQPTAADEFLVEFWMVGYPGTVLPPLATMANDFQQQHGTVPGINWRTALGTQPPNNGMRPTDVAFLETRQRSFTWEQAYWPVPPVPPAGRQQLERILRNSFDDFDSWQSWQEGSRTTNADGTTTIPVSFVNSGGNPMSTEIKVGRPGVTNPQQRTTWLAGEDGPGELLAAYDFTHTDFTWSFSDTTETLPDGSTRPLMVARGVRTIVRVERELLEPGTPLRRAHPPLTDPQNYASEVPLVAPSRPLGENVPVESP